MGAAPAARTRIEQPSRPGKSRGETFIQARADVIECRPTRVEGHVVLHCLHAQDAAIHEGYCTVRSHDWRGMNASIGWFLRSE
jgi:hypothetical protein